MGVMDQNGIVGVVNIVGDHSARLISRLNPYLRISCKVKGHDHVGSLTWDGEPGEAILEELPSHAHFQPGATIVTSGFSSMFPEGVHVVTVIEGRRDRDEENFFALRVKLFTDFSTLSTVRVIVDSLSNELRTVEKEIDLTPSR